MSTTQPIRDTAQLQSFKDYYLHQHPDMRNYTLCMLGLNTALRIADVLHLKWGDVYDFQKNSCRAHVTVTERKTGKTNVVALNRSAAETLEKYYAAHLTPPTEGDYLFQSRKGSNQPLGRSQAYRIVKQAAAAVGLNQHVSCHSLRKTFGYHAWRQGIPPALLMDIYNHSSYRITRRYLGIQQDDKDQVFLNISL